MCQECLKKILQTMSGVLPVTESRDSDRSRATTMSDKNEKDLPFLKEDIMTDIILVVEGRKLYLSKSMLYYASEKLLRELLNYADEKERKKSKPEIKIDDKNYADFVDLFSFIHPGVKKELTENMALRLIVFANKYDIQSVKTRCENFLRASLKKLPISKDKKNAPGLLKRCLEAADPKNGNATDLLEQCISLYSNPEVVLKDVKQSHQVSDGTKAKIYEKRMESTASTVTKKMDQLNRERHEKEMLKKQISDKIARQSQTPRYLTEPTIEKTSQTPASVVSRQRKALYYTSQRQSRYAENILGPVKEFSRNEYKDSLSHRSARTDQGD